jgi:hypothetical protein
MNMIEVSKTKEEMNYQIAIANFGFENSNMARGFTRQIVIANIQQIPDVLVKYLESKAHGSRIGSVRILCR